MEHGAKLFIENKDSKTACDLSEEAEYTDIATYLEGKMVFSVSYIFVILSLLKTNFCC